MNFRKLLLVVLGLFTVSLATYADDRLYQTSDVIDVTGTDSFYQGAAWLVRSEDEIEGRIMTTVPTAGEPYTLWIVVFNNPELCAGEVCNAMDLGAAGGSVFSGSGAISAPNGALKKNGKPAGGGVINIDFEFEAGGVPKDLFVLVDVIGPQLGLDTGNGLDAEIHLIIDRHPPVPEGESWIPDLTTTNFPGAGPATNNRAAVFLPCPSDGDSCPDSIF